jgi:hypothetical protein
VLSADIVRGVGGKKWHVHPMWGKDRTKVIGNDRVRAWRKLGEWKGVVLLHV